mmetsp:Transcript_14679/g.35425  ORF Transcript_14679/g.35425 Transcript_14679/m.35425 type:complete len:99 (+) Transcript_14679:1564-1860(+)
MLRVHEDLRSRKGAAPRLVFSTAIVVDFISGLTEVDMHCSLTEVGMHHSLFPKRVRSHISLQPTMVKWDSSVGLDTKHDIRSVTLCDHCHRSMNTMLS